MDREKLDYYLYETIKYLKNSTNPSKGVVAASLISNKKVIYATSEKFSDGKFIHAERNVLRKFIEKYGHLPEKNSIMVATLSPCSCQFANRVGNSCIQLLTGNDDEFINFKISKMHVGLLDPTQDISLFLNKGFKLTVTDKKNLIQLSKNLFSYFDSENNIDSISEFVKFALKDI